MPHLDGNALAGQLAELFAFDATTASVRCVTCGTAALLATDMFYPSDMGAVLRCASCDAVLLTIVDTDAGLCLSVAGIATIEVRRAL